MDVDQVSNYLTQHKSWLVEVTLRTRSFKIREFHVLPTERT